MAEGQLFKVCFEHSERAGLIEDPNLIGTAKAGWPFADRFEAKGVESADPHFYCGVGIHCRQPLAHLFGGLVGKCQSKEAAGKRTLVEQMFNAADKGSGLAGARPGIDQKRPLIPCDSHFLAFVEFMFNAGRIDLRFAKRRQKKRSDHLIHDQRRRQFKLRGNFGGALAAHKTLVSQPI
jgi:hypothetical protein